jgi:hypothetical protein
MREAIMQPANRSWMCKAHTATGRETAAEPCATEAAAKVTAAAEAARMTTAETAAVTTAATAAAARFGNTG